MADIKKLKSSEFIRRVGDHILKNIPLPKVHPDVVSALSLVLSIAFLFSETITYQVTILGIVWLLDILDGAIAKRYYYRKTEYEREQGWMIDVTTDRLSEGVIAIAYFIPLFPLFILNTIFTLFSYTKRIHLILPLRQGLFVYLIIKLIIT